MTCKNTIFSNPASHLLEEAGLDDETLDQINIDEPDPHYMKSVYRCDYQDDVETLRQMFDTKSMDSLEDIVDEGGSLVKSDKPIQPLNSSLRVCPGPPRFYKTCRSEYQDTFDMVGRMMTSKEMMANKAKMAEHTVAESNPDHHPLE